MYSVYRRHLPSPPSLIVLTQHSLHPKHFCSRLLPLYLSTSSICRLPPILFIMPSFRNKYNVLVLSSPPPLPTPLPPPLPPPLPSPLPSPLPPSLLPSSPPLPPPLPPPLLLSLLSLLLSYPFSSPHPLPSPPSLSFPSLPPPSPSSSSSSPPLPPLPDPTHVLCTHKHLPSPPPPPPPSCMHQFHHTNLIFPPCRPFYMQLSTTNFCPPLSLLCLTSIANILCPLPPLSPPHPCCIHPHHRTHLSSSPATLPSSFSRALAHDTHSSSPLFPPPSPPSFSHARMHTYTHTLHHV